MNAIPTESSCLEDKQGRACAQDGQSNSQAETNMSDLTTLYKLTDENDRTYGGCQWGPGVGHATDGKGDLCGPGFTHWCLSPELAVLLNPIQGNFDLRTAHLWRGEGVIVKSDYGLKVGCTNATTIERIPLPAASTEVMVTFAILCEWPHAHDSWREWVKKWLTGEDRSAQAWAAWSAAAAASAAWSAVAASEPIDLVPLAAAAFRNDPDEIAALTYGSDHA